MNLLFPTNLPRIPAKVRIPPVSLPPVSGLLFFRILWLEFLF